MQLQRCSPAAAEGATLKCHHSMAPPTCRAVVDSGVRRDEVFITSKARGAADAPCMPSQAGGLVQPAGLARGCRMTCDVFATAAWLEEHGRATQLLQVPCSLMLQLWTSNWGYDKARASIRCGCCTSCLVPVTPSLTARMLDAASCHAPQDACPVRLGLLPPTARRIRPPPDVCALHAPPIPPAGRACRSSTRPT